jgi:hypothetical protein
MVMMRVSPNSTFSPVGWVTSQFASIVVRSRVALARAPVMASSRAVARSSGPSCSAAAGSAPKRAATSAPTARRRDRFMMPPPLDAFVAALTRSGDTALLLRVNRSGGAEPWGPPGRCPGAAPSATLSMNATV